MKLSKNIKDSGKNSKKIKQNAKYLVIGTKIKSKNILSYDWEEIPNDLNLADFNRVIINIFALNQHPEKIKYFNLNKYNINNLIFNIDAEIIVIGIPSSVSVGSSSYSTTWWLPVEPIFTDFNGDTFKNIEDEFLYYFEFVDKWYFHFEWTLSGINRSKIDEIFCELSIDGERIEPNFNVLAENIYGKPLALKINYFIKLRHIDQLIDSAKIIWLPPPTKVETEEAIIEILKKRYKIILSQDEPNWVKQYRLPEQIVIEYNLDDLNKKIQQLNEIKNSVIKELQEQLYFRKLLYEKGEALEKVVLLSLKNLGADIQEVKEENIEDGRIIDPYGRYYIIEIKSSNGQLIRRDIRQLNEWCNNADLEENWNGKGIIIGNYFCDKKLAEREYPINDNEKKALERFEFSVIKTSQLFRAIQLFQKNNFQKKTFWDNVFNTNGLCSLPDIQG